MSKSPPGVKRVVSVLNFFAEHPGQSFTFTDIVKALKLGRATCHALLAGLVEERYLYRNADKTYVIGPGLVAIGRIAAEQFSPLQAAQPEMRLISDECGAICAAVYHEHGNAVIRARAGAGSHLGWSVPQGYEAPLKAPFAAAFFAWSKSYEVAKWVDQLSPPASALEQEQLNASIEFTRKHGFSFGVHVTDQDREVTANELWFSGERRSYPVASMAELDPSADYRLAFVTAPVFGKQGEVMFVLNLSGFNGLVHGSKVKEMGERLLDGARRVTFFITGNAAAYPF
jgi:DNA-binding IclR family transcriptional regulator